MNDLEYTPGPWRYNEMSPTRVTGLEGETVAATYGGIAGATEQVANTRLIAAAPTMFEYLAKRSAGGDAEAQAILDSL